MKIQWMYRPAMLSSEGLRRILQALPDVFHEDRTRIVREIAREARDWEDLAALQRVIDTEMRRRSRAETLNTSVPQR